MMTTPKATGMDTKTKYPAQDSALKEKHKNMNKIVLIPFVPPHPSTSPEPLRKCLVRIRRYPRWRELPHTSRHTISPVSVMSKASIPCLVLRQRDSRLVA